MNISSPNLYRSLGIFTAIFVYTVFSKKTPTHIFLHISMNDVWFYTKIAVNIPKER